jgi:hypothetical protein
MLTHCPIIKRLKVGNDDISESSEVFHPRYQIPRLVNNLLKMYWSKFVYNLVAQHSSGWWFLLNLRENALKVLIRDLQA